MPQIPPKQTCNDRVSRTTSWALSPEGLPAGRLSDWAERQCMKLGVAI
jgi:hypothetical protein